MSRLPFLFLGIISLAFGILSGLARTGIPLPHTWISHSGFHSAFMISGFFGTVISLERAVAIKKPWAYVAPICSALASISLITELPNILAVSLFIIAGTFFVAASLWVVVLQPAIYSLTLLTGSILWLLGSINWLILENLWGSIPYGLSFLVLTIAGERLELTRFLPPKKSSTVFFLLFAIFVLVGTFVSGYNSFSDNSLLGAGFSLLATWLIIFDIARRTISKTGVTRFVAVCLLSGYFWLFIGGILLNNFIEVGIYQRDAAVHSIALGFVFAMVIGHAPIIFPAISQLKIPFTRGFYLPLALINLGLLLRLDAAFLSDSGLREIGSSSNAAAILMFLVTIIYQVSRGLHRGA